MPDAVDEKLTRLLTDLGDSPDAVAAYLEGQGCVGHWRDATRCPVARYLQQNGYDHPCVSDALVIALRDGRRARIITPDSVARFLDRFDAGAYPALRAKGG